MVPYWRNMLAMVWSDLGESYLWACWAIGKMQLPYRSTSLWKSPHLKLYPMRKFILTEKKCVLSLWYHSVKTRWLWSCYTEQLDRCIYLYKQQCHVVYKVILYIGFFLSCECNSYLLLKKYYGKHYVCSLSPLSIDKIPNYMGYLCLLDWLCGGHVEVILYTDLVYHYQPGKWGFSVTAHFLTGYNFTVCTHATIAFITTLRIVILAFCPVKRQNSLLVRVSAWIFSFGLVPKS